MTIHSAKTTWSTASTVYEYDENDARAAREWGAAYRLHSIANSMKCCQTITVNRTWT